MSKKKQRDRRHTAEVKLVSSKVGRRIWKTGNRSI